MEVSINKLAQLAVAKDPNTDRVKLAELAKMPDEEILCAVAANPNTSPSTLAELQSNLPIFFEEDEDFDGEELDAIFSCIAGNLNTPVHILVKLADNYSCGYKLAKNPNTPEDILIKFANYHNSHMLKCLIQNPALSSSMLEKLATFEPPRTHTNNFNNIKIADIRQEVLNHPNVSNDAIAIVHFMEGNANIPDLIFEKLATSDRMHVLSALAACSKTPHSVLEAIAEKGDIEIQKKLALVNSRVNSELLEKVVLKIVERYNQARSIPERNETGEILLTILKQREMTVQIIEVLSRAQPLDYLTGWIFKELAKHPLSPPSVLANIIAGLEPNPLDVYKLVADNENTPAACLNNKIEELFFNPHPNSVEAISCLLISPKISAEILKKLYNRKGYELIHDRVRKHPNFNP
jgi:hypothetical protein